MSWWPIGLLVVYCALIFVASIAGGVVPIFLRLTHSRMQLAVSFVSGLMLSVAFFHLLPHAIDSFESHNYALWWTLAGFLLTFFIQRFVFVHQHVSPQGGESECDDDAPAAHPAHDEHPPGDEHEHDDLLADRFSWGGAAIGLTVHSLIAGAALAANVEADWRTAGAHLAGLATFIAIVCHKPFDSLTITTLMTAGGWSARARHLVNAVYAVSIPLGAALFYLGMKFIAAEQSAVLGGALGLSAGAFLCVAASDLLPEMQFHSHDRGKLSLTLLSGVLLGWIIAVAAHDHSHHEGDGHQENSSQHESDGAHDEHRHSH